MEGSIAPLLETTEPLAVLAGGGVLPGIVASAAIRAGRPVKVIGIRGEADLRISTFIHDWVDWGEIGQLLRALRAHRATELVLVGRIKTRPDYRSLPLDRAGALAQDSIVRIFGGGDNAVLAGAVRLFESRGFRILGAHQVARELVAPIGSLSRGADTPRDRMDIDLAMKAAKSIGTLDIGQAAVSVAGRVVALEGAEGTDGMLERVAQLKDVGRIPSNERVGVLGKCAKPHQDLRIDMPTIGPDTVAAAVAAGLAGIAVEAGSVMIAEREETIRSANANGLFLVGAGQEHGTNV